MHKVSSSQSLEELKVAQNHLWGWRWSSRPQRPARRSSWSFPRVFKWSSLTQIVHEFTSDHLSMKTRIHLSVLAADRGTAVVIRKSSQQPVEWFCQFNHIMHNNLHVNGPIHRRRNTSNRVPSTWCEKIHYWHLNNQEHLNTNHIPDLNNIISCESFQIYNANIVAYEKQYLRLDQSTNIALHNTFVFLQHILCQFTQCEIMAEQRQLQSEAI